MNDPGHAAAQLLSRPNVEAQPARAEIANDGRDPLDVHEMSGTLSPALGVTHEHEDARSCVGGEESGEHVAAEQTSRASSSLPITSSSIPDFRWMRSISRR